MLTALIFAHDRWGSTTTIDYETEALELLNVMRHKEDENGGVVDGVTNTFDVSSGLPFTVPTDVAAAQSFGRPSIVMPAYYDLWAQATGDAFWTRAAAASRDYWRRTANPTTGPDARARDVRGRGGANVGQLPRRGVSRADQHGARPDLDDGGAERLGGRGGEPAAEFFPGQGIDNYSATFTLDGVARSI